MIVLNREGRDKILKEYLQSQFYSYDTLGCVYDTLSGLRINYMLGNDSAFIELYEILKMIISKLFELEERIKKLEEKL